jgi:hypothetical protein
MWLPPVIQGVSKGLYKGMPNVFTKKLTNYPSLKALRMQIKWFVRNSVSKCFIRDNEKFLDSIIVSDESNCKIWGREDPRVSLEHVRDGPKVNVFCTLSKERVYGPFIMETTITGIEYLDKLQQFLIPQLGEDDQDAFTYSKKMHPLITLEKCVSTSTSVSQVGGLVEQC